MTGDMSSGIDLGKGLYRRMLPTVLASMSSDDKTTHILPLDVTNSNIHSYISFPNSQIKMQKIDRKQTLLRTLSSPVETSHQQSQARLTAVYPKFTVEIPLYTPRQKWVYRLLKETVKRC